LVDAGEFSNPAAWRALVIDDRRRVIVAGASLRRFAVSILAFCGRVCWHR
jgi:hypothetical protein